MKKFAFMMMPLLSAFLFAGFDDSAPEAESIVVIVNNDNPVGSLTAGEVKLYYTRKIKKRWTELKKNIRPADRKNKCPERDMFYFSVLGMKDNEVEEYFTNKQLQNAERPQDKFASETEMIDFVSEERGAIGFIKASSVTPEVRARVKVVLTL